MHRRLFISFCLLLAFAMLQAHNFIPHQHIEIKIAKHHHDHDKHHHHDDEKKDKNVPQPPVTHLTHNADFGKVIAKPHLDKQVIKKPGFCESMQLQLYDKLASFTNPKRPHPPDYNSSPHLIFLSYSIPLRAPPIFS